MRVTRIVTAALLAGTAACVAYAQTDPYGGSPGPQGQYDQRYSQQYSGDDAESAPGVDVGFFYDELSPYGEWVRHPQYGWVWFPSDVEAGWRPYSLGRWVDSDYGWTWVSDEPFGWATYHYGRWAWDPYAGWLWVPGTDWGPAWVAWQQGNGYVGWAPLPPAVGFEMGVGIRLGGFDLSLGIAPRDYAFVEERRFLDSSVGGYIVPEARNVTIIHNTTNITNYTVVDNRVINHGVPIQHIEQATGRTAPVLRVATAPDPRTAGVQRDVINIYRPPQTQLQTVKVAPRNNAGLPQAPPLPIRPEAQAQKARPPAVPAGTQWTAPVPIPVAPRISIVQKDNTDSRFMKEQENLKANLDKQQKVLEQIHRQELAQAQASANAQEVAQRHAAELKAQQEQRELALQVLQTQQQIRRQAAQVTAVRAEKSKRAVVKPSQPPKNERKNDNQTP